jgi:hypothetical protein
VYHEALKATACSHSPDEFVCEYTQLVLAYQAILRSLARFPICSKTSNLLCADT